MKSNWREVLGWQEHPAVTDKQKIIQMMREIHRSGYNAIWGFSSYSSLGRRVNVAVYKLASLDEVQIKILPIMKSYFPGTVIDTPSNMIGYNEWGEYKPEESVIDFHFYIRPIYA